MVHCVEQQNLIDSPETALDYSYLFDMLSSPLLPPEEQQQPPQMNSQEAIPHEICYDPNSYDLIALLMSNGVLEETPNHQTEGHDKSFVGDINMMIDSGSTQVPSDPKTTTTATAKAIKLKKKGLPWTKSEHELFLEGMERYGKGDWKSIARTHVLTRTAAQVASHAQKYFARLKRVEKTGGVRCYKAGASSKDSRSLAKPVVEPTVNVPPSDNGNVRTTFLNPASDFGKVPHTFTNRRPEEYGQTNSTIPFSSRDSAIINHADLFPPWKFSKVNPTIYIPPSDVFPSDEDVYIPSIGFIAKPTSENNNVPTTIYVPQSGNICPDPDLSIHSVDSISAPSSTKFNIYPTISVFPLNDISTNPDVWIQSLDFPKNPCSDRITANPSDPVYPLYNSFPDHDVYRPSLDLLDAFPSNNTLVHPTFHAPPSNVRAFDSTKTLPPNDFTSVHPAAPFAPPSYYTVSHTTCFTPRPSDTTNLPPQDNAYVIKW